MTERLLKLYLFSCSIHSGIEGLINSYRKQFGDELKPISIPCAGKLDLLYLVKLFETGAEGVILISCGKGECKYLEGNLRALKRVKSVDALLEEIGMGGGRVMYIEYQEDSIDNVLSEIVNFRNNILKMSSLSDCLPNDSGIFSPEKLTGEVL
jgi:coenzyme F420-reducing hydrogenase delta subunit